MLICAFLLTIYFLIFNQGYGIMYRQRMVVGNFNSDVSDIVKSSFEIRRQKSYKSFKHKFTKTIQTPRLRRNFPETWIWPIDGMNSG